MDGRLVVVAGASGGLGASTAAVAIAAALAPAGPVVVVDMDVWGSGLQVLCGVEEAEGVRWPDLADLEGTPDGEALLGVLPAIDGVAVLSWAPHRTISDAKAFPAVRDPLVLCQALQRAGAQVVVDAGRLVPAPWWLETADLALCLVDARMPRVAATVFADRVLSGRVPDEGSSPAGLVLTGGADDETEEEICAVVHVPVVHTLGRCRQVRRDIERGFLPGGRGAFARLGRDVCRALAAGGWQQ